MGFRHKFVEANLCEFEFRAGCFSCLAPGAWVALLQALAEVRQLRFFYQQPERLIPKFSAEQLMTLRGFLLGSGLSKLENGSRKRLLELLDASACELERHARRNRRGLS